MIIGVCEKDRVFMGYSAYDDFCLADKEDLKKADNISMWKVKGNPHTIIGCDRVCLKTDALRYSKNVITGRIDFTNLISTTIPAISNYWGQFPYLSHEKVENFGFMIAQEDRLYMVDRDRAVLASKFMAKGRGDEIAIGALEATKYLPATDRILKAFRAIEDNVFPVVIMDTATGKRKVYNK